MRQSQSDSRDQVPGLGEMPFFGGAFRNTARNSEKRELVILLKTTVVRSDQTWAQNILDTSDRVQSLERRPPAGARRDERLP